MNRIAGMTGPEHFLAGEDALQRAETTEVNAFDITKAALHSALITRATAHFQAAQTLVFAAMAADGDDEIANGWAALLRGKVDGE